MKNKILFSLFIILFSTEVYAQKEQYNWLFGHGAALTWNTKRNFVGKVLSSGGQAPGDNITVYGMPELLAPPAGIAESPLATDEGCFVISGADGQLLLFSDGSRVWDARYVSVASSLMGNASSTQSGIAFPYPGITNRYAVVSLDQTDVNRGAVSVSDVTDLGVGSSVSTNASFQSYSGVLGESVAATIKSNKEDYWILAPGKGSPTYFNTFEVTRANGIRRTAVNIFEATNLITSTGGPQGYLKFSPDGKRFFWITFDKSLVFGDFDNATGVVSNVRIKDIGIYLNATYESNTMGYGLEFSPNGNIVYMTNAPQGERNVDVVSTIMAFNVSDLGNTTTQIALDAVNPIFRFHSGVGPAGKKTALQISNYGGKDPKGPHFSALQLGPDNKLYIADFNSRSLVIIDDPDNPSANNNVIYLPDFLGTGNGTNNKHFIVAMGLPSFARPWFKISLSVQHTTVCSETTSSYELSFTQGLGFSDIARVEINFGDGGPIHTINNPNVTTTYTVSYKHKVQGGPYRVVATAYSVSGGVSTAELDTSINVTVQSCSLPVNRHIRGVMRN